MKSSINLDSGQKLKTLCDEKFHCAYRLPFECCENAKTSCAIQLEVSTRYVKENKRYK